jgi:hypothetical protein
MNGAIVTQLVTWSLGSLAALRLAAFAAALGSVDVDRTKARTETAKYRSDRRSGHEVRLFVQLSVWASHSGLVSAYSTSPWPAPSMTSVSGPS